VSIFVHGEKRCMKKVLLLIVLSVSTGCSVPRWPVAGTMTSPFGFRMRGWSPDLHKGVDVSADEGTPVKAMQGGTVVRAGEMPGYGLAVILQHGRSVRTVYGHLSRVAVKSGARVRGGQLIGNVGHTGNATGPHLHFEVWRWNQPDDPVPLLGGMPPRR
jgi:murein DD-endopeptidase MepM/ murein hydrolase activator NlpD